MGVSKTVTVTCDYAGCVGSKTGPAVLTWNETEVSAGRQQAPEEAKYLVVFTMNGIGLSFCCQLHAAEFFLPPGYEAKQKQVIELSKQEVEESGPPWMAHKLDQPMELRSETESVPQPDGYSSPDNGPEKVA
jgi:hypothetical protein